MKGLFVFLFALVAIFSVASASFGPPRRPPPLINRPPVPRSPFGNTRFRRSPEPEPEPAPEPEPQNRGSVSVQASGNPRRPTFSIDANRQVWGNRHGSINVGGGVSKTPGSRPDPHVGVSGTLRFKRSPEPQNRGSVSVQASGSPRRPTFSIDANRQVWGNRHGSISVGGGVSKTPGSRPDPHVGVSGSFRFKRSPEPQNRGSVSVEASGSPKRPSVNVEANHKVWGNKHGSINVGGGVSKQPGRRPDPHVGISGSFKF